MYGWKQRGAVIKLLPNVHTVFIVIYGTYRVMCVLLGVRSTPNLPLEPVCDVKNDWRLIQKLLAVQVIGVS